MGRTLDTYRMRLRRNQEQFARIMKSLGMSLEGFNQAWLHAEQGAMSGSLFPHAKTSVISALSMLPGVYGELEGIPGKESIMSENTFSSWSFLVNQVVGVFSPEFIDPWVLPSTSPTFGVYGGRAGLLRELLMTWFIPFLSPRAQHVMLKVFERPEVRDVLDQFWDYPGDVLVFFLHFALYDLFSQVRHLKEALRERTREEKKIVNADGKRDTRVSREKTGSRGRFRRGGRERGFPIDHFKFYRQLRLEL